MLKQFFGRSKRRVILDSVPVLLEQFCKVRPQAGDFGLPGGFGVGDEVGNVLCTEREVDERELTKCLESGHRLLTFCHTAFRSANVLSDLYSGSTIIFRIVTSHVHDSSTRNFLSR